MLSLIDLLEKCGLEFEKIKGTSKREELCNYLAKKGKIEYDEGQIGLWVAEWESMLNPTGTSTNSPISPEKPTKESVEVEKPAGEPDSRKLFVGGLPNDVNEVALKFVFEQFGAVEEIEIKRDSKNKRSRGFGFVIFADPTHAAAAAQQRSILVRGKAVEVQLALPSGDPSLAQRTPDANCKIFVGGLTQECTEQHLADYFSAFGSVLSCEVKRDYNNGRSRGFGFVTFHSPQAAEDARSSRPPEICGRQVEVLESMMRGDPGLDTVQRGPDPRRKIFVGGLPQSITEEGLADLFSRFGDVLHTEIKRDFTNERSRGFGFVIFSHQLSAEIALETGSIEVDGKQVDVQPPIKKGDPMLEKRIKEEKTNPQQPAKIFIGGLSQEVTDMDLLEHFGVYGSIISVEVKRDNANGRSRGFGFVTFQDSYSVQKVHSVPFPVIRGKRAEVKAPVACSSAVSPTANNSPSPSNQPQRLMQETKQATKTPIQTTNVVAAPTIVQGASVLPHAQTIIQPAPMQQSILAQVQQTDGDHNSRKLFIGGLPKETTEFNLLKTFASLGQVTRAEVIKDKTNGRSRGYGFVTYENTASVVNALSLPKGSITFDGRVVEVRPASKRSDSTRVQPTQPINTAQSDLIQSGGPVGKLLSQFQVAAAASQPASAFAPSAPAPPASTIVTPAPMHHLNDLTNINAFLNFSMNNPSVASDVYNLMPITSAGIA